METVERRTSKRVAYRGLAMLRCGGLSLTCGGVDLSEGGVRLELDAPATAPWQPIDVLLGLSSRGWVQLRARVRRVEQRGAALRWALAFEDPSAHALRAVRETLVRGERVPPLPKSVRSTPPPLPAMRKTPTEVSALLEDDEPTREHAVDVEGAGDVVYAQQPGLFRLDSLRRRG